MSVAINLPGYIDALTLLGDENRMRLCALLRDRELCVTDLVRITGIAQSRVSTHLGAAARGGPGPRSPQGAAIVLRPGRRFAAGRRPHLPGRDRGLRRPDAGGRSASVCASSKLNSAATCPSTPPTLERDYSPGRTWQSLTVGIAALLRLGDVLDVGSGDGAAAAALAPYCRSLTCIDVSERLIAAARERLGHHANVRAQVADAHALPFEDAAFDSVLVFHTLTYAEHPARVLKECARVLRPGGRRGRPLPRRAPAVGRHGPLRRAAPGILAARRCAACSRAPA